MFFIWRRELTRRSRVHQGRSARLLFWFSGKLFQQASGDRVLELWPTVGLAFVVSFKVNKWWKCNSSWTESYICSYVCHPSLYEETNHCVPLYFSGIFCYQCTSNNSLADCRGKQMVVNCTFPQNHCYRSNVSEGNARAFFQGCISSDQCIDRNEVALKCCAEDLCNGGKIFGVSFKFLVIRRSINNSSWLYISNGTHFIFNSVCQDDPYYADNCSRKASVENYCHDQETFMREHCPKSCNFCKGEKKIVCSSARFNILIFLH